MRTNPKLQDAITEARDRAERRCRRAGVTARLRITVTYHETETSTDTVDREQAHLDRDSGGESEMSEVGDRDSDLHSWNRPGQVRKNHPLARPGSSGAETSGRQYGPRGRETRKGETDEIGAGLGAKRGTDGICGTGWTDGISRGFGDWRDWLDSRKYIRGTRRSGCFSAGWQRFVANLQRGDTRAGALGSKRLTVLQSTMYATMKNIPILQALDAALQQQPPLHHVTHTTLSELKDYIRSICSIYWCCSGMRSTGAPCCSLSPT
ncbi:hypothetical protein CBR_g6742 [Chara braunii]|uniref:Uncharacterized protein n=1 Tax=Chara braunii TaxID=69332 RepID=A0A388KKR0_CHABU|nr:hypothetical protein CBR_g6742 [Chara braunii]|eukprot:GBG70617.1 hypothetical protein CBR_g6742 [Chara braunii]